MHYGLIEYCADAGRKKTQAGRKRNSNSSPFFSVRTCQKPCMHAAFTRKMQRSLHLWLSNFKPSFYKIVRELPRPFPLDVKHLDGRYSLGRWVNGDRLPQRIRSPDRKIAQDRDTAVESFTTCTFRSFN